MFGMADLVTVSVIRDGLEHLANNPYHCRYILGAFTTGPLSKVVNQDHINEAIDFITQNKIQVAPYYSLDMRLRPTVAVVSSGAEAQQYIGDYGHTEYPCQQFTVCPIVYTEFDAKLIQNDIIYVPAALNIETKIWPNVIVTNGSELARVKGILVRDGQDTQLQLDKSLPDGTLIKGWKAQSQPRDKGIEVHSSMDKVTLQVNLMTTGHASVHRLLAVVIRYCLKRGRQLFEQYGLQIPTFSYSPMILNDDTELEFQTVFTIETSVSDTWINREFDLNDNTKKIVIDPLIAVSANPNNDEVELE